MEETVVTAETPPAVETPPATEPKIEKPELVSDKFAALARKEKSIVKARQELAQAKQALEQERQTLASQKLDYDRWIKMKENAKLDPDAYLNEAGISYGYLTERALKGGSDPNAILEKANQTIADFKKSQEDERKRTQEDQKIQAQKDWEERVQGFVQNIHEYVDQNKETYELINIHGQQNLVWEVINEAARRGQQETVKTAADKVEKYLSEQVEKAVTSSKKFKEKYALKVAEEVKVPGTPTLNNSMNVTTPVNPGIITDQERTQRALAALNKALGE